jgi:Ca-activated chloride channel homolog
MRSRLGLAAALAAALAIPAISIAQACTPPNRAALLILDLSDSMIAKVPSGEARIDVARHAVEQVVAVYPPEGQLALRVYGSDSPYAQMNCKDSRLLVPFAPASQNKQAIIDAIWGVGPRGLTPIAFALDQARHDFPTDAKDRMIVLVSDGRETCSNNPCAVASDLASQGFLIHTVGLVVDRNAALQLQCIATVTGGMYVDVPNAIELPEKLKEIFQACKISEFDLRDLRRLQPSPSRAG